MDLTNKELIIETLAMYYLKDNKQDILTLIELFDKYLDWDGNFYLEQKVLFSVSALNELNLVS